ncbi:MAG: NUDIX domain-containing protein [Prevotella sp.]|nr:NUDIX domain-containing protein [Prevotella sp.]
MSQDSGVELFPVVDEAGNVLEAMTRSEAHCGTKKLHPVVHLHVFNSKGELYLQHRAAWKEVQPDKWDTATGGHVDYGETVNEALAREVYEEIGLRPDQYKAEFRMKYVYESKIERELVYVFTTVYDGELSPSETETSGGKYWALEDIKAGIGREVFTPMFEKEIVFRELNVIN